MARTAATMGDTVDRAATPVIMSDGPAAALPAAGGVATPAGADPLTAGAADDAVARARRLPSGWYLLGLAVQVFLWFLVFLGIAIAIGVGGHLTEFRYVGF